MNPFIEKKPSIDPTCFIHTNTTILGDVEIKQDSSVWPGVVIRGDVNHISIGERSNIQDNSVIHVSHDGPVVPGGAATTIGNDVTVGHMAMLHGCRIADRVLIGIGVKVLDKAVIESDCVIAAGSLIPPGKICESGFLYLGSPAKKIRPLSQQEIENLLYSAQHYVKLKDEYLSLSM